MRKNSWPEKLEKAEKIKKFCLSGRTSDVTIIVFSPLSKTPLKAKKNNKFLYIRIKKYY